MQTRAIRVEKVGGPEVLEWISVPLAEPGPQEVRIRHHAIGLNFIDVYHRTGLYQVDLPATLGVEAAGVVEALGSEVTTLAVGDRVAYAGPLGAYCEARNVVAERTVKVPDEIGFATAASVLLKGMTARYLLVDIAGVARGDTVVVHAAAGGTGRILVEWAAHLGAKVVAVVSSKEKAKQIRGLGAAQIVVSSEESFVEAARKVSDGRGVDVVFDSVGKDTFVHSIDALRERGMLVSFGQSSGKVPPFELSVIAAKSLFLTRPSLAAYTRTRDELELAAEELFAALKKEHIHVDVARTYPLSEAREAHRALEARETSGATVLLP